MKALTVQQPWAWAIVHGGKDVENRTQAWTYRGPLAIHAGARWSDRGAVASPVVEAAAAASPGDADMVRRHGVDPRFEDYHRGAVIGVVDLVDAHREHAGCCDSPWGEHDQEVGRLVHLELANPRPLPEPIPCKGRLGLWTPPADVLDQLQAVTR